jgi:hypothetical protein
MATNFPTGVDTFTNPVSNDSLNSPSHSTQHANANDAIEAIENAIIDPANYPDQLVNKTTAEVRPLPFAMQAGAAAITGSATVTWAVSTRFTQTPRVLVTIANGNNTRTKAVTSSVTTTSFTVAVYSSGTTLASTAASIDYLGIQMTSASGNG